MEGHVEQIEAQLRECQERGLVLQIEIFRSREEVPDETTELQGRGRLQQKVIGFDF